MDITTDSHLDHNLTDGHVALIRERFGDRQEFFIETVELPEGLDSLPCDLHGPIVGDEPIPESEVFYEVRGNRPGPSRMVRRPSKLVKTMTVIGGPHEGKCILFTAYGGPCASREPWDESLDDDGRAEAKAFWAEHALNP